MKIKVIKLKSSLSRREFLSISAKLTTYKGFTGFLYDSDTKSIDSVKNGNYHTEFFPIIYTDNLRQWYLDNKLMAYSGRER